MPEWAEAVFALGATVLAVVAFRFGAAARRSPEGGEVAARFGRFVVQAGVAAGATGAGTFSADREPAGSLPVVGWALLMVAALALTSGFALRLGAGWSSGPAVSPARRVARYLMTAVIAIAGVWLGDQAADAAPRARVVERSGWQPSDCFPLRVVC